MAETVWPRETDWAPARRPNGVLIDRMRLQVRALEGLGQALVSGDLDAGVAALALGAPMLGLHALAPSGPHAIRIARDRALLVTPAPLAFEVGWRGGWAATDMSDGWVAIDVTGPDAPLVRMQGTAADLEAESPSAAVLFAGRRCLLLRTEDGFRLHCEAPWLEALLTWLDGA